MFPSAWTVALPRPTDTTENALSTPYSSGAIGISALDVDAFPARYSQLGPLPVFNTLRAHNYLKDAAAGGNTSANSGPESNQRVTKNSSKAWGSEIILSLRRLYPSIPEP